MPYQRRLDFVYGHGYPEVPGIGLIIKIVGHDSLVAPYDLAQCLTYLDINHHRTPLSSNGLVPA
jgi:hypothetical protein